MSEKSPPELQQCIISLNTMLVIIALNDEENAFGSTIETLVQKTGLGNDPIELILLNVQELGLLKIQLSQENSAGRPVLRYKLLAKAKEIRIPMRCDSTNRDISRPILYVAPPEPK